VSGTLLILVGNAAAVDAEWKHVLGTPGYYLSGNVWGINSKCWTPFMLYVGTCCLDFTYKWLRYGQETIVPLQLHQPVSIAVTSFVVWWNTGITVKLLSAVLGSPLPTLGLVELAMKRIDVLCRLLGVKRWRRETSSAEAA
jgi:hypothetical protein